MSSIEEKPIIKNGASLKNGKNGAEKNGDVVKNGDHFKNGDTTQNGDLEHTEKLLDYSDNGEIPPPPDGGWGWVIVFASFMIHVIGNTKYFLNSHLRNVTDIKKENNRVKLMLYLSKIILCE